MNKQQAPDTSEQRRCDLIYIKRETTTSNLWCQHHDAEALLLVGEGAGGGRGGVLGCRNGLLLHLGVGYPSVLSS